MKTRPYILTIAGLDPSNGAGLTADIKTFEALKCYGLSVCTAITVQNDRDFKSCNWVDLETIKEQIAVLYEQFTIDYVKIGIVENWGVLLEIIRYVKHKNPKTKIVLDPVLKASSNFVFHESDKKVLDEILNEIFLITPNYDEIEALYDDKTIEETITHLSQRTHVLLKGGHREHYIGKDQLFLKNGSQFVLNPKKMNCSEKHGSGCVLSSAITAYLALDFKMLKACFRAKRYIEKVLSSNKSLLGYHG